MPTFLRFNTGSLARFFGSSSPAGDRLVFHRVVCCPQSRWVDSRTLKRQKAEAAEIDTERSQYLNFVYCPRNSREFNSWWTERT